MNKKMKVLLGGLAVILIISIIVVGYYLKNLSNNITKAKIDDWKYSDKESNEEYVATSNDSAGVFSVPQGQSSALSSKSTTSFSSKSESTLGLSVGGSKNIDNFRENIKNGYFPISTDITYNGLFYDYYFETGKQRQSEDLFSPSYSMAISKDPISSKDEYYMTVGLNSNIKQSDFERKKQNIVVVLDISGSMESSLQSYYYDEGNSIFSKLKKNKSKMELANEAVNLMIDELNDDDRFGMVLFDDEAYLGKPLSLIGDTDIKGIKGHILDIEARGGTNFEAGYKKGTDLFDDELLNNKEYDNRIIVITDAMPNVGLSNKDDLFKYVESNSNKGIYTSFIGVGVDFNTEVIEKISNVRGANYYSISSKEQFKKILSEDFEYMVTPLVFDLSLNFESAGYDIEKVYGTDSEDKSSGNIMKVNTLFPSSINENSESKGGVILLKLKKKDNQIDNKINLSVSYTDRNGNKHSNSQDIEFNKNEEFYENTGIRKAVALTRYANTLKNWILYERTNKDERFYISEDLGVIDSDYEKEDVRRILGENERTSVKLTVSEEYKENFRKIKSYLENEKSQLKDDDLKQEIDLLEKLINY